jgi:hypothetical protein
MPKGKQTRSDRDRPLLEPTSRIDLQTSASINAAFRPVSSIERGSAGRKLSSASKLANKLPGPLGLTAVAIA